VIYKLGELPDSAAPDIGGKAFNLHRLIKRGCTVPEGYVLSTRAYRHFTEENGLKEKLALLLHKKNLESMRWEEIWDLALTIEHQFLQAEISEAILSEILEPLQRAGSSAKAVRSSSTLEDLKEASFAGLHNSYVDVTGTASVVEAVKQVWASLWTDRSLMFRKELGLTTEGNAMAVIIQNFISGDFSGVLFTRHPNNPQLSLIETVPGWNDKLVSGRQKPERYALDRQTGALTNGKSTILDPGKIQQLFDTGMSIESIMGSPQDIEWTFLDDTLFILQARAITATSSNSPGQSALDKYRDSDKRSWALSLRPGMAELLELENTIKADILPRLEKDAEELAAIELENMEDSQLEEEIKRREKILQDYTEMYWEYFIPYGHAFRLLGELYNRYILPESPFEFIELLSSDTLISVERNRQIEALTSRLREDAELTARINGGEWDNLSSDFMMSVYSLMELLGSSSLGDERLFKDPRELMVYLAELSRTAHPEQYKKAVDRKTRADVLTAEFLNCLETKGDVNGKRLLQLARDSYSLRDNDNMYFGKIKGEYLRGLDEQKRRSGEGGLQGAESEEKPEKKENFSVLSRQLIGAPAVHGIGTGNARLVNSQKDLTAFQPGEIIVCTAVDPAITFIVPLAAAIVEKRGGMLIHGAIIAREYGIPCVTGVEEADELIQTGDSLIVDGYLGIVTITNQRTSR